MCESASSFDGLVSKYNGTLKNMRDKNAPQKSCLVVERPVVPWYTDRISEAKCWKRKLEKQMKKTGLTIHRGMFKTAKTKLRMLMAKSKAECFIAKFYVIVQIVSKNTSAP